MATAMSDLTEAAVIAAWLDGRNGHGHKVGWDGGRVVCTCGTAYQFEAVAA